MHHVRPKYANWLRIIFLTIFDVYILSVTNICRASADNLECFDAQLLVLFIVVTFIWCSGDLLLIRFD